MQLNLSLVLGGAASGKSAFAERLVRARCGTRVPVYIATAEAFDEEMAAKIARHRDMRGPGWRTVEAPSDLCGALATLTAEDHALIDCATLWLSNRLLAGAGLEAEVERLLTALAACPARLTVVSNETGLGIVPDSRLGRQFRNAQGTLNQRLAAQAGLAVAVIAGLPLVLKGRLPEGFA